MRLVPAVSHAANQFRKAIGDPPEDEKRGLDVVAIEQVERPLRVLLEPGLEAIPLAAVDQRLERRDVEIVLERDRQDVRGGLARRGTELTSVVSERERAGHQWPGPAN